MTMRKALRTGRWCRRRFVALQPVGRLCADDASGFSTFGSFDSGSFSWITQFLENLILLFHRYDSVGGSIVNQNCLILLLFKSWQELCSTSSEFVYSMPQRRSEQLDCSQCPLRWAVQRLVLPHLMAVRLLFWR